MLSAENRFNAAYKCIMQCAMLGLWAHGYRTSTSQPGHHQTALQGYIESKGGKVLAAVSLTGKPHSAKLALSPERLHELRSKHGSELETWWIGRFAHAFDALTESEARYLARTEAADTIRDRIADSQ